MRKKNCKKIAKKDSEFSAEVKDDTKRFEPSTFVLGNVLEPTTHWSLTELRSHSPWHSGHALDLFCPGPDSIPGGEAHSIFFRFMRLLMSRKKRMGTPWLANIIPACCRGRAQG